MPGGDLIRFGQEGAIWVVRLAALLKRSRRVPFGYGRLGPWPTCCVEPGGVADEALFQGLGAVEAAGDAGEDQRDVTRIEMAGLGGGIAPLDLGGEVAAIVDQLADQGEEAADAAWRGVWTCSGRRVGHERKENAEVSSASRNSFLKPGGTLRTRQRHTAKERARCNDDYRRSYVWYLQARH